MPYTGPILLTGDMVASVSAANQVSNPNQPGFGMNLTNVQALGGPTATYRLVWVQNVNNPATTNEFLNGQGWQLQRYVGAGQPATDTSPQSWSTVPGYSNLGPRHDIVSGVGGGDEYIVFQANNGLLLYNINGGLPTTPTNLFYSGTDAAQNGGPGGDNDSQLDFSDGYAAYCFCDGTLIDTGSGLVAVERLAVGDLVLTLDHGLQPIRWIGRRAVTLAETVAHPQLLPVRVAAGAMGQGLPKRDLWLSPQHRVLVQSAIASRMAGPGGTLVAVTHLAGLPGITRARAPRAVNYVHIRLDRHEVVKAEGTWAETLLLGRQALQAMGPEARQELRLLFPGLVTGSEEAARPVLPGRAARRLADRHARNAKLLLGEG
ncbi:MAG: hypothetical protein EAZ40_02875 [Rhodobacterales bacterium]|nr:MAG: hypothetical protein EAZ40_02875 [Rhodobacterales bacterium]